MSEATLVLNATYEPLGVISVERAIILVLTDRATCVEEGTKVFRSAYFEMFIPTVIKLNKYAKIPHRTTIGLSRRAIFARDGGLCAYCDNKAETIDHVIPKSKGGGHAWENVVAACAKCNHKKGDKSLTDMGWKLTFVPVAPTGVAWRIIGYRNPDPSWKVYL